MHEQVTADEPTPPELSSAAKGIALEAAQAYLLSHPEAGTISELPSDDGKFRHEVHALWSQRSGNVDPVQFETDFAALKGLIETMGAEELILQERDERAKARQARAAEQSLPEVAIEVQSTLVEVSPRVRRFGGGVLRKFTHRS